VRAIVVSGVGHETDVTIADFAADLRAPTPTAAAELSTPDVQEMQARLAAWQGRLRRQTPAAKINRARQRVDELILRADRALAGRARLLRAELNSQTARLGALSPLAVLERGYAVVRAADGRLVRSTNEVQAGEQLDVRVQRGSLTVEVKDTKED